MKKITQITTISGLVLSTLFFALAQESDTNVTIDANSESGSSVKSDTKVRLSPVIMQARIEEEKKRLQIEARNQVDNLREQKMQVMNDVRTTSKGVMEEMRNDRQDAVRSMMQNSNLKVENDIQLSGESAMASSSYDMRLKNMDNRREEMRRFILDKQEEFRIRIKNVNELMRQNFEEKKIELKEKLKIVKDERKVNLTLNINDKFQTLNSKVVNSLNEALNRKETVLNKLKEEILILSNNGKDTADLNSKVMEIEGKIAEARSMIITQSSKVYSIDITNEAELKSNVEQTNIAMKTDVKVLQDFTKNISDLIRDVADNISNK